LIEEEQEDPKEIEEDSSKRIFAIQAPQVKNSSKLIEE